MFLLWSVLLASAVAHQVTESTEDIPAEAFNTTTLYPVRRAKPEDQSEKTDNSWKIETTFTESNLAKEDNSTVSKGRLEEKPENASKEFKASPHLGSFFEASVEVEPTPQSFGAFNPVIKKPPAAFTSLPKKKHPKDIFKNYNGYPYKIESPILTRAKDNWRPTSASGGHSNNSGGGNGAMEPAPTADLPSRVPAGGLYQLGDPFSDKPDLGGDDDFGLEFSAGGKDVAVKKRMNPWKKLLHLVTAFIPVGLIISALTPSVITIQNTGIDHQLPYRGQAVRRADVAGGVDAAGAKPLSESCRRRLLCELQDRNHSPAQPSSPALLAPCERLRCEEPAALSRTLRRLLRYRQRHLDHRHLNT